MNQSLNLLLTVKGKTDLVWLKRALKVSVSSLALAMPIAQAENGAKPKEPRLGDVASLLASKGYRVLVPCVRRYGTTRFLSGDTFRNGQPSALAVDAIASMDALRINKIVIGGFDWGGRSADIIAALWPERCKALLAVSGYLIGNRESGKLALPPRAELQWWYHFYFATERGRAGDEKYRRDFAKLIWQTASQNY